MTSTEILAAQIDRARLYFKEKSHLDYLNSAREIIDANAHCGGAATLNANQTQALAIFLESQSAIRETKALLAVSTNRPSNIIQFARN